MGPNGANTEGIYNQLLGGSIGKGAYDMNGTRNTTFMGERNVGPFPEAMRYAWSHVRIDAAHNLGLNLLPSPEEWGKLGSLAMETTSDVGNRGAAKRPRLAVMVTVDNLSQVDNEQGRPSQDHPTTQEWREAMAETIDEARRKYA